MSAFERPEGQAAATPGPWETEADLPYGRHPSIYGATQILVAVVGNAIVDQDRGEADAAKIVHAVNNIDRVEAQRDRLAAVLRAARDMLDFDPEWDTPGTDLHVLRYEIDAVLAEGGQS